MTYLRLLGWLLGFVSVQASVLAQDNNQILFVGLQAGYGIIPASVIGPLAGIDVHYQYPLGSDFVLTGRSGLETFAVKDQYKAVFDYYYGTTTGLSVPITVGARYYVYDGLYAALNLGVDIGRSGLAANGLRYEPAFGYALPLPNGDYIDFSTSFITSFRAGNGLFSAGVTYGFNFSR